LHAAAAAVIMLRQSVTDFFWRNAMRSHSPGSKERRYAFLVVLLTFASVAGSVARADIEIVLKNSFIEEYKDRVSIDANFTVDAMLARPHPPKQDGDIHIAGRADEIGLPAVVEIMNAKFKPDVLTTLRQAQAAKQSIPVRGAWRLWCEHGGSDRQVQGDPVDPIDTTNPQHVFEIHPITHVNNLSIADTLTPIDGYTPSEAATAFSHYEDRDCEIIPGEQTTTIRTTMARFNYVEFIMEINSDQKEIADGRMMMARVYDLDGDLRVHNRRMVFPKDSPAERFVRNLPRGTQLHVLGIPRINLTLVDWRVKHSQERPGALKWKLPYEIIVVGVYDSEVATGNRARSSAPRENALFDAESDAVPGLMRAGGSTISRPMTLAPMRSGTGVPAQSPALTKDDLRALIREEVRAALQEAAGSHPGKSGSAPLTKIPKPAARTDPGLNEEAKAYDAKQQKVPMAPK
jgi:hypothetical protein